MRPLMGVLQRRQRGLWPLDWPVGPGLQRRSNARGVSHGRDGPCSRPLEGLALPRRRHIP